MTTKIKKPAAALIAATIFSALLFVSGCQNIRKYTDIRTPKITVNKVKVSSISFSEITLNAEIIIDNPNPFGFNVAGIDYKLSANGKTLLKGVKKERISIKSSVKNSVYLPLTLSYSDIYKAFSSFKNKDEIKYELTAGIDIDIPYLGNKHLEGKASGALPLLKLPGFSLKSVRVKDISLSKAEVEITVEIDNPNAVSLDVDEFDYKLKISGEEWASASLKKRYTARKQSKTEMRIPVSISLSRLGSGVYKVLTGGGNFDYSLTGKVKTGIPEFNTSDLPVSLDKNGKVKISR
jgi:LEA14-like dessication related protein